MKKNSKSRENAVQHGIFAGVLLREACFAELRMPYSQIVAGLQGSLQPMNLFEQIQVEKLAFLYIRLLRLYRADVELALRIFRRVGETIKKNGAVEVQLVAKEDEIVTIRRDFSPETLIRYENNIERQIIRTLDMIERSRRLSALATTAPSQELPHAPTQTES